MISTTYDPIVLQNGHDYMIIGYQIVIKGVQYE